MTSERNVRVRFPGGSGHELAANLELPAEKPRFFAVFAPCFTCLKDAKAIVHSSRALAAAGVGVLRYDVTGIGDSDGDFTQTDFSSQVADLQAAAEFLRREHRAPQLILGISLGGAVALSGAREIPEASAVATVNAPSDTQHLRDLLLRAGPRILVEGAQEVELLGRRTHIGRALLEDLPRHDVLAATKKLGLPLLLCHAVADEIVAFRNAEKLFAAAAAPRSLLSVADTDHLLLRGAGGARWVGEMIAVWAARQLTRSSAAAGRE